MVNDARTAAGGDDGADYLAAVEALCSLGERTERELAGCEGVYLSTLMKLWVFRGPPEPDDEPGAPEPA